MGQMLAKPCESIEDFAGRLVYAKSRTKKRVEGLFNDFVLVVNKTSTIESVVDDWRKQRKARREKRR